MAERSAVKDRTMFQILLMVGSVALHKLNMIKLVDLFRRTGHALMSSGLVLSLARRLIRAMLFERGIMIKNKPQRVDRINVESGKTNEATKLTGSPFLESHLEICSFGKQHLPTVGGFTNSNVYIMDLPQSCDCCCGGIGRCITTKEQVPFDLTIACVMQNNKHNNYCESKSDMKNCKSSTSTDIMACEYTKNIAMSVELTTSVTGLTTSSVNRLSSADSGIGNICLSVQETVTTCSRSRVKESCALMSEMEQIAMVTEVSAALPQSFHLWGTGDEAANLLPVSGCVYDATGRIIRMTVHFQSAESDLSSSDGETEDVFELFWQPGDDDDEYFKNENSVDDDCPSDDSDVFICFEDPVAVQNCAGVSIILEPSNIDDSFFNPFGDTSERFDFQSLHDIEKDCPRKSVSFKSGSDLVEIHQMVAWNFAYRSARKGPWEREAADRAHFRQRIKEFEPTLTPVIQEKLNKISTEKILNQTHLKPRLEE